MIIKLDIPDDLTDIIFEGENSTEKTGNAPVDASKTDEQTKEDLIYKLATQYFQQLAKRYAGEKAASVARKAAEDDVDTKPVAKGK